MTCHIRTASLNGSDGTFVVWHGLTREVTSDQELSSAHHARFGDLDATRGACGIALRLADKPRHVLLDVDAANAQYATTRLPRPETAAAGRCRSAVTHVCRVVRRLHARAVV